MSSIFKKNNLKFLDFLIIFIFFVFFLYFSSMIFKGNDKLYVEISSPYGIFEYDINYHAVLSIDGNLGKTDILIDNNTVCIQNSPCSNKTCVQQEKISKAGQWLCCAPNQILVVIKASKNNGTSSQEPDAISF